MADKIITIRMNEGLQAIYEKRVEQVNKLAPESKLTIGGSVKYGAELFALEIAKADVEKKLICPLTHSPIREDFAAKFEDNPLVTEEDRHFFSHEETKALANAFDVIHKVFSSYKNMSEGLVDGWKYVRDHYRESLLEHEKMEMMSKKQMEYEEMKAEWRENNGDKR